MEFTPTIDVMLDDLSKEIGRNTYDSLNYEISKWGFALIKFEERETKRGTALIKDLENSGWTAKLCDKGLVLCPPRGVEQAEN